jgi:Haem-binding domain
VQLVPYGRGHTNFAVAAPAAGPVLSVADQYCPKTFAPGTESAMNLGAFRTQVNGMAASLDAAIQALAVGDQRAVRAQYAQFAGTYGGVSKELAELYPVRCRRLIADRLDGDAAILVGPVVNLSAGAAPVAALRAGIAGISTELSSRIQQASPDALIVNAAQTVDAPLATGAPSWDNERTSALATRACAACHSNQPGWSWYTNVAPVSWLVQHDVDAGRAVLNFSEWDRPQSAAAQLVTSVEQRRMPPAYASLLNADLQLSDAERLELARGLLATLSRDAISSQAAAVSSPVTGSAVLLATLGTALAAVGFALGRSRALTFRLAEQRHTSPQNAAERV